VKDATSRAEKALNALSFVFAVLVAVGVARLAIPHVGQFAEVARTPNYVGSLLSTVAPEAHWSAEKRTVALVLRSTCPYCQKSAPFHRKLARLASEGAFNIVVLTDEPVWQVKAMLKAQSIDISEVYAAQLSKLGVVGTPTVFTVSSSSNIERVWQGLLTEDKELDVVETLNVKTRWRELGDKGLEMPLTIPVVLKDELDGFLMPNSSKYIVDVRARAKFKTGHLPGAVNIPWDELQIRAIHELPKGAEVAVYCEYHPACEASYQDKGVPTRCSLATSFLSGLGFHARLLTMPSGYTRQLNL
jgi:hypothetical protein